MNTTFSITEQTPIAALTIGQFRELFKEIASTFPSQPKDDIPEVFGKNICSVVTGYSINSINRFICEKKIPYYKSFGKVFFKKADIMEWLLSNRIETVNEFCDRKDEELLTRKNRSE